MNKNFINLHEGLVADTMPEKFVDLHDGKGGFVYNYGIETESVTTAEDGDETEPQTVTRYRHNSLVCEAPKTQNNILSTLLAAKYADGREQKLLNDYYAAKEKILPATAKDGYLQFLADRKAIKDMIEADCTEAGIPNA